MAKKGTGSEKVGKKAPRFLVKAVRGDRIPEDAVNVTLQALETHPVQTEDIYVDCQGKQLGDVQTFINSWSRTAPTAHYHFYNFTLPEALQKINFKPEYCSSMLHSAASRPKTSAKPKSEWSRFLDEIRAQIDGNPDTEFTVSAEIGETRISATMTGNDLPKKRGKKAEAAA